MSVPRQWTLLEVEEAVAAGGGAVGEAIEWFWRNGELLERHSEFIRRARIWCRQPSIRVVIERLRPPPPVRVEKQGFPGLMDWLALSSALNAQAEVLDWFDERVAREDVPLPRMSRLQKAILERGRVRDWLAFSEPLQGAQDALSTVDTTLELFEDHRELALWELEETDCEVALWRRVAASFRPDQLEALDAAIATSTRVEAIQTWLSTPPDELIRALLSHCVD